MKRINPGDVISAAWVVFLVVWLISSFAVERIAKRERGRGIGRRLLTLATAWILLADGNDSRLGVLAARFLPSALWIAWVGAGITVAGVLFAIWARIHIGRYWSATVALKNEHELIRSGPYARIRHPIYTGIILAIAGSALAIGTYAALLALLIFALSLWLKGRKEEALLAGEFGTVFEEHRRRTGFFLPKLS